jgi:hypothetical protein
VISPLAEGTDCLVARRILERRPEARLLVPLPMPKDDYVEDFTSAASREEFESLLARARCIIEMQAPAGVEGRSKSSQTGGEARDGFPRAGGAARSDSYLAAGTFVVDHCDVLIVVWDRRRAQGRGGTAEVVALARRRRLPIAWIRAGNRKPGTNEPASLGDEQGKVAFERFEALEGAGDGRGGGGGRFGDLRGVRDPSAAGARGGLPYRIRIAVAAGRPAGGAGAIDPATAGMLRQAILGLFDARSRERIARARHTPIAFSVLPACDAADGSADGSAAASADGSADGTGATTAAAAGTLARALDARLEALPRDEAPFRGRRGRFVVGQCDVVIALGSRGTGGRDAPGCDAILAQAEAKQRPVIHVDPGPPCLIRVSRGHGLNAQSIVRLDMYNRFPVSEQALSGYVANTDRDIFDSEAGRRLPAQARENVRTNLLPCYARASLVAKRSQRIYRRAGKLVWLLFPAAIAAVAAGVLVPALAIPAFGLEFLLLAAIAVVVTYADRQRSLQVWIESRFLAERARAAAYLAACGHEIAPLRVPPYMGGAELRDAWMVMAFNETRAGLPRLTGCTTETWAIVRDFVSQGWAARQIEYHRRNATRCERLGKRLERWGTVMFLLALIAAGLHIALPKSEHSAGTVEAGLTFLAILLPAAGAAMGGFRSHREFSRLAKRSRSMAQELQDLQERLAEVDDSESVRRVLREVEETMLGETQDWLALMRFVPVQYPG